MRNVTAKAVVIILAFSCMAFAQDFHFYPFTLIDQQMVGSGARARAMGGAFLGLSDDASALTWNPAGLIQTEKTHVAISGNLDRLKTEDNISFMSSALPDFAADISDNKINLSYASFVSPLRIKGHLVSLAAGYQKSRNYVDEIFNWEYQEFLFSDLNTPTNYRGTAAQSTTIESDLDEFLLGFGTNIYGDLAFGGSLSIFSGAGMYDYSSSLTDTVADEFGGQVVDSVEIVNKVRVSDETDISGFKLAGSLLYVAEKFSVGLVVSAPYELSYEHDLTRADTLFSKSIDIVGEGLPNASTTTLYRGKTKEEVPLTIGFGAAVKPSERLTLVADFQYRGTSNSTYFVRTEELPPQPTSRDSINLLTLPWSIYYEDSIGTSYFTASGDYVEIFSEFEMEYENSNQIAVGGEYMAATRFGEIPLRAGFRYSALPYREVSNLERNRFGQVEAGYTLGDQVTRNTITLGSGIHWNQIWLDFTVELKSEEQVQSGTFVREEGIQAYENMRKRSNSALIVNFTGFF